MSVFTGKTVRLIILCLIVCAAGDVYFVSRSLRTLIAKPGSTKVSAATLLGPAPKAPANYLRFPNTLDFDAATIRDEQFRTVSDVKSLPFPLPEFYGFGTNSVGSGLANPDEEFRSTDVSESPDFPAARLIMAANRSSDGLWIIESERARKVVLIDFFRVVDYKLQPLWECASHNAGGTISEIRNQIISRRCR